jgi:hypothetical protein
MSRYQLINFESHSHEGLQQFLARLESQIPRAEEVGDGLDIWHASLGNATVLVHPKVSRILHKIAKEEAIQYHVLEQDMGKAMAASSLADKLSVLSTFAHTTQSLSAVFVCFKSIHGEQKLKFFFRLFEDRKRRAATGSKPKSLESGTLDWNSYAKWEAVRPPLMQPPFHSHRDNI